MYKMVKPTISQRKQLASKMMMLERKMHAGELLSDEEHSDLKDLHSLDGSGLFDDIKNWVFKNINPIGRIVEYSKKVIKKNM